jgi:hypothetical protein
MALQVFTYAKGVWQMKKFFNKTVVSWLVAGGTALIVPTQAVAGNHGGNHGGNHSNSMGSFKSSGGGGSNFKSFSTSPRMSSNASKLSLNHTSIGSSIGGYHVAPRRDTLNFQKIKLNDVVNQPPRIKPHFSTGPLIDPGIGNGHKPKFTVNKIPGLVNTIRVGEPHPDKDSHKKHHGHHHKPWPWYIGYGLPVYYTYPVPIGVPVTVPVQTTSVPRLVHGIDLQLLDVRLLSLGDPSKNLGPLFRVVIGNQGTRPAGAFQVLLVGSKGEQIDPQQPNDLAEVPGVESGKVVTVNIRLPLEAMTMADDQPFRALGVIIDPNQQIVETTKDNNAALIERTKIR